MCDSPTCSASSEASGASEGALLVREDGRPVPSDCDVPSRRPVAEAPADVLAPGVLAACAAAVDVCLLTLWARPTGFSEGVHTAEMVARAQLHQRTLCHAISRMFQAKRKLCAPEARSGAVSRPHLEPLMSPVFVPALLPAASYSGGSPLVWSSKNRLNHCMNSMLSSGRALISLCTSMGCSRAGCSVATVSCEGSRSTWRWLQHKLSTHLVDVQFVKSSLQDLVIIDAVVVIHRVEVDLYICKVAFSWKLAQCRRQESDRPLYKLQPAQSSATGQNRSCWPGRVWLPSAEQRCQAILRPAAGTPQHQRRSAQKGLTSAQVCSAPACQC